MKITAICKRVRSNNGIVQVLFTMAAGMADHLDQDEHVLINAKAGGEQYAEGETYLITVEKAPCR